MCHTVLCVRSNPTLQNRQHPGNVFTHTLAHKHTHTHTHTHRPVQQPLGSFAAEWHVLYRSVSALHAASRSFVPPTKKFVWSIQTRAPTHACPNAHDFISRHTHVQTHTHTHIHHPQTESPWLLSLEGQ